MWIKAHVQTVTGHWSVWISTMIEVANNATDDEIGEIVDEWAMEQIDYYWEKVEVSNEKAPSSS